MTLQCHRRLLHWSARDRECVCILRTCSLPRLMQRMPRKRKHMQIYHEAMRVPRRQKLNACLLSHA